MSGREGGVKLVLSSVFVFSLIRIQLLECPISPAAARPCTSQKPSQANISGTKRGITDPLVSKRPEKILNQKIKNKKKKKNVTNCQKCSNMVKMVKMV